jgi:ketosteroid isomerase-like protein
MANSNDETKSELADIIRNIYDTAFEDHDAAGTDAPFHDNASLWDAFEPRLYVGKEQRMEFHTLDQVQLSKRGPITVSLEEPLVDTWGDTAIARYHLDFSFEPPNAHAGRIRITDVFRRVGGKWVIMHHHEGNMPNGFPPTTE